LKREMPNAPYSNTETTQIMSKL